MKILSGTSLFGFEFDKPLVPVELPTVAMQFLLRGETQKTWVVGLAAFVTAANSFFYSQLRSNRSIMEQSWLLSRLPPVDAMQRIEAALKRTNCHSSDIQHEVAMNELTLTETFVKRSILRELDTAFDDVLFFMFDNEDGSKRILFRKNVEVSVSEDESFICINLDIDTFFRTFSQLHSLHQIFGFRLPNLPGEPWAHPR
jgi:hypothetical protein